MLRVLLILLPVPKSLRRKITRAKNRTKATKANSYVEKQKVLSKDSLTKKEKPYRPKSKQKSTQLKTLIKKTNSKKPSLNLLPSRQWKTETQRRSKPKKSKFLPKNLAWT